MSPPRGIDIELQLADGRPCFNARPHDLGRTHVLEGDKGRQAGELLRIFEGYAVPVDEVFQQRNRLLLMVGGASRFGALGLLVEDLGDLAQVAVRDEVRYWLARPMVERVSAVELIRRATWGIYGDAAPAQLVRVSQRLEAPWVRFLLVGAHALAAHGRPRATQDLDVLVAPTAANARKVSTALAEFGFTKLAAEWRWFTKPYRATMLGRIPA